MKEPKHQPGFKETLLELSDAAKIAVQLLQDVVLTDATATHTITLNGVTHVVSKNSDNVVIYDCIADGSIADNSIVCSLSNLADLYRRQHFGRIDTSIKTKFYNLIELVEYLNAAEAAEDATEADEAAV